MEQIESTLVQITSACHPPDYTKGDDVIHACLVQVSKLLSIWSDILHYGRLILDLDWYISITKIACKIVSD